MFERSMGNRSVKSGFTLIELLTAMAIIALLAAILLPVGATAVGASRSAMCQNNLHCWGVAMVAYVSRTNGYIPRRGQGIQETFRIDRDDDWFNCLAAYVGQPSYKQRVATGQRPRPRDGSIFVCPEARDDTGQYFFSYAMNMYLSPWVRPAPHTYDSLACPERTVFMADAAGPYSSTLPSVNGYNVLARHNGRANLCFVDGHVESHDGVELGCGVGDPHLPDVRWETGSGGINQAPMP